MKKNLLFFSLLLISLTSYGQGGINNGLHTQDSTVFTLDASDTLSHIFGGASHYSVSVDTSNTHVWRIGKTRKSFFAAGGTDTTFAIMTDTSQPYPANANDWFVLKIKNAPLNVIIDFVHKFMMVPLHAGGIVEYSRDSGTTWQNVMGVCNSDSFGSYNAGIHTQNFYSRTDTIITGEPAFTRVSTGWQYSRVQFSFFPPMRLTKGTVACPFYPEASLYVRFRFFSDSTPIPQDGWIIDSIKVEARIFPSSVPEIAGYHTLNIAPNPSTDGVFIFPALNDEKMAEIDITNTLGQTLFTIPYTHTLDLSSYPKGLYLYRVKSSTEYYSGRLIIP